MFDAALPYEEPTLVTILILSSFLLVLNVLGAALDHVVYCGLVGQVLVGMAWGTPGAKILSRSFEEVATQLGFLGLICIVFEGGLSTSAKAVRSSLVLSISVALTGILLPIAFSFSLIGLSNASHLQAFAAGSALCSTSLGTTFSLLKTTGLTRSRLGTVLTTAAMLDDVVGLIMVQVIANLGSGGTSVPATTIVRPIFVSFGFAVVFPIACRFLVPPIVQRTRGTKAFSRVAEYPVPLSFLLSTAFLVGLVTAANSAGTSILFAAYLAGAIISWIDETIMEANAAQQRHAETIRAESHGEDETNNKTSTIPVDLYPAADEPSEVATSTVKTNQNLPMRDARVSHELTPPPEANDEDQNEIPPTVAASIPGSSEGQRRSEHMYHEYYSSAVERVLKPFFFVSAPIYLVSLVFCCCSYQCTISLGFNWLFHSDYEDVSRRCRLAWFLVRPPNGCREALLRCLAYSLCDPSVHLAAFSISRRFIQREE